MKSEAQTFFIEFSKKLHPFSDSLGHSLAAYSIPDAENLSAEHNGLVDANERLTALKNKIDEQEAFLLIFGPLKSGKSTLMNAISGTYVSEVTSLPAYPALVYVKNGKEPTFSSTSYAGNRISYASNREMASAIDRAHQDLAARLREVERNGESFDPMKHFTSAIRRMDIEIKSPLLGESSSVLVDTPGLYSKMRFGYEMLSNDFRDTAACAIFVVKADNLFFEKVFEEFTELLGVFSKVFLVANIDTSKMDLHPDGSLHPSVESRRPEELINAFRSLAMSAELSAALDDGRLKIYPIDLLHAGARSLQAGAGSGADQSQQDSGVNDGFDRFLQDLSDYLSSNEYLNDLMVDSLRLAERLKNEVSGSASRILEKFEQKQQQLQQQLDESRGKLQVLGKIEGTNWQSTFSQMYFRLTELVKAQTELNLPGLEARLKSEIESWMNSDESLAHLLEVRLGKPIETQIGGDSGKVLSELLQLAGNGTGGGNFNQEQREAMQVAGFAPGQVAATLLDSLSLNIVAPRRRIDIPQGDIPLKRGFLDIILFRSQSNLNRKLFGDDGARNISAIDKQKKLKGPGREKIESVCREFIANNLAEIESGYLESALNTYVERICAAVKARLTDTGSGLEHQVVRLTQDLQATSATLKNFRILGNSVSEFSRALDELREFHIIKIKGDIGLGREPLLTSGYNGGCMHHRSHADHDPIDSHTCHCSVCKRVTGQSSTHVVFFNHDDLEVAGADSLKRMPFNDQNPNGPLELCVCKDCGTPIMLDDKQGRIRVVVPNLMGYDPATMPASYHAFYDPDSGVPRPDDGRPVYEGLRPDFVWPASKTVTHATGYNGGCVHHRSHADHDPIDSHTCHCSVCKRVTGQSSTHVVFFNHDDLDVAGADTLKRMPFNDQNPNGPLELCVCEDCGTPIMLDDKQGRIRVVVPNLMGYDPNSMPASYHAFYDPASGVARPDDGRPVYEGLRPDFVWPAVKAPAQTSGYNGGCMHHRSHADHDPIDSHTCHCSVCKRVTGQSSTHVVFFNHDDLDVAGADTLKRMPFNDQNPNGPLELCVCEDCGTPVMLDDKQGRIRVVVPNLMGYDPATMPASYHAFYDPASGVARPDDGRPVYEGLRPDFVWPAGKAPAQTSGYNGGCVHHRSHADHDPIDSHTCHCSVCKRVTGQSSTHVVFFNHDDLDVAGADTLKRMPFNDQNPNGPLELCVCEDCGTPIMLDDKQGRIRVVVPNLMGYDPATMPASYHAFYDPASGVARPDDGRPVYEGLRPDFVWPASS